MWILVTSPKGRLFNKSRYIPAAEIYHLEPAECCEITKSETNEETTTQNSARWTFQRSSSENSNTAVSSHLGTLVVVQ